MPQQEMSDKYKDNLAEHEELRFLAERLRVICLAPQDVLPEGRLRALLERELTAFGTMLEQHLSAEESGSYLGIEQHPELESRLDRLRRQHQELRGRLGELRATLSEGSPAGDLPVGVVALLDALAEHESAENRVLQDSLLQESGRGD